MSPSVHITCPQCFFSRDVPREAIPTAARQVNCPRCGEKFPLPALPPAGATSPSGQPSTVAPPSSPPQHTSAEEPPTQPLPSHTGHDKPRRIPFTFNGTARGYFGIWIVNALLKMVTLGIYSPWAKVRKRRYFFGNTLVERANFDYLADPMALLRGWLLGIALFMGYSLVGNLIPLVGQLLGLLFFFAVIPWLVVRSRMFNSRYSAHRNIRFSFFPDYRESYIAYAGFPLLSILTAGILLPYAAWRQKRFLVENTRYGRTPFTFHARARDFYLIALKTFGMLILVMALFISAGLAASGSLDHFASPGFADPSVAALLVIAYFAFIAAYLMVILFWQVRVTNLTWSSTRVGPHRLQCNLRTRDMLWIYLSSALAIMASLGLLIPWASVRLARYRVGRTALLAHGNLDSFVGAVGAEVDALGEEVGDIFDIDIEIGF